MHGKPTARYVPVSEVLMSKINKAKSVAETGEMRQNRVRYLLYLDLSENPLQAQDINSTSGSRSYFLKSLGAKKL